MQGVRDAADDHRGQPQFVEKAGARIVRTGVDDQHAVHAVLGPPAPVHRALVGHVLDHLEQQAEMTLRQHLLDAGDQLKEERVHAERVGGPRHDQTDGGRPSPDSWRAAVLGRQPSCSATRRTRSRVTSETLAGR